MKHIHSEVIKAFVDGKECEYYFCNETTQGWVPLTDLRDFHYHGSVRLKPELEEPQYLYVYNHTTEGKTCMSTALVDETYGRWKYMGKVRVEK